MECEESENANSFFLEREVPHEEFEKVNIDPKEPFAILRAETRSVYRMHASIGDKIPPGYEWVH